MKLNSSKTTTIDAYIQSFPKDIQEKLKQIRSIIQKTAPHAEEAIRYQMPTFRLNNKNLIHFAAFTNHIGLYPAPVAIKKFMTSLKPYKTSKGAIQFSLDQPLPLDLIAKITNFRINEINQITS